ncbi:hypothetical protein ECFRIK920_3086 [Escherichia coli FRIK920]|nr:hypothetical protein ECFRIK920_3086 [Escherichia coli FRIK920]
MQGEFDFGGTPANHAAQFGAQVDKFRADLADMAGQCVGGSADGVPWICGDTTYFWKQKNESSYQVRCTAATKTKRKRISISYRS